jgi:cytochrome P450
VLLLNAGHEASVNGAANGWWSLFRHPDQLARFRDDPSIAATAIDELLRFDTPLALFERYVLEDIEVAGVHLPRGAEVALQFARMELQIAFTTLLRRCPGIRLLERPRWKPTYVLRGVGSLQVRI